ncbi:bifunctional 2-polyprenyl-6-hydroxyphenol methylase/3-demethylubiquinol 3-O-methyltransferase UbiG [Pleionea sp. CnH1-48]|uniref:class I SAM-dependent methyltransferase n=1 Tax=Pleionea sp. CnH1-48 TaxID=2954494 RepID=UPI0020981B68|nr:class I SAM-dependent methyltransferase [Pleionea sp. CnH1-48]MCO7224613.1 methyltransferase domain-containing protein [Pleionea sp. CnH1-48]
MMEFIEANRKLWNERVDTHVNSEFYDNDTFLAGRSSLNDIELALLGDVKGKRVLHLQCHFGQDSLSLARMGAKVTGVDLSDKAILKAQELNEKLGLDAEFICSDVMKADEVLAQEYDLVFTSYGTIGWLPELNTWAKVIDHCLKPGGKFLIVDFHPVLWMFDANFKFFEHSYFNAGVIQEESVDSYVENSELEESMEEYGWNHSLEELFQSLLSRNLMISHFKEYDYSPYNCFNRTVKMDKGYQIEGLEGKLPMVYALGAEKPKSL